jgi:hypothetical protein
MGVWLRGPRRTAPARAHPRRAGASGNLPATTIVAAMTPNAARLRASFPAALAEIGGAKAVDFTLTWSRRQRDAGRHAAQGSAGCARCTVAASGEEWLDWCDVCSARNACGRGCGDVAGDRRADRREQSVLAKSLLGNLLAALDDLADHFVVRPQRGARGPRREYDRWDKMAPLAAIHPELARAARRAQEER